MPEFPEWYAESLRFIAERERQGVLNTFEAERLRKSAKDALIIIMSIGLMGEMNSTQLYEPEILTSRRETTKMAR